MSTSLCVKYSLSPPGFQRDHRGIPSLSGAPVTASDLRASAALVMAGLVAKGTTTVHRVYHIDRGYQRIDERVAELGGRISRLSE